jgi:hypothetical protein
VAAAVRSAGADMRPRKERRGRRSAQARARKGEREGKERGAQRRRGILYRRRGRGWGTGHGRRHVATRRGASTAWGGWGLTGGPLLQSQTAAAHSQEATVAAWMLARAAAKSDSVTPEAVDAMAMVSRSMGSGVAMVEVGLGPGVDGPVLEQMGRPVLVWGL